VSGSHKYACLLASGRKKTEDRAVVIERGDSLVIVVADGAGGTIGGAAASDALVGGVGAALADNTFDAEDGPSWSTLFSDIDAKLAKATTGETTGVVIAVSPRVVLGVSAGDSQAWVVGSKEMDDLTAGQSKKRLGSGRAVPVFFSRPSLEGTLIAGTDGLFNYVPRGKDCESRARTRACRRRRKIASARAAAVRRLRGRRRRGGGRVVRPQMTPRAPAAVPESVRIWSITKPIDVSTCRALGALG
jgi:hypothetical protein